ncbi:hypothetical protein AgCh_009281 [Apium graveolens]
MGSVSMVDQAFAQLLQAPHNDAQQIIRDRFPVPRLVVYDQHGSQTRFLLAKLNLSATYNNASEMATDHPAYNIALVGTIQSHLFDTFFLVKADNPPGPSNEEEDKSGLNWKSVIILKSELKISELKLSELKISEDIHQEIISGLKKTFREERRLIERKEDQD